MESALLLYLAKASVLITLFFLAYYLLLKKETFFASIRFFLLSGIITAAALPLITFTKTVWVTPEPISQTIITTTPATAITAAAPVIEDSSFEINWWYVVMAIYTMGVIFFAIRFIIDISTIVRLLHRKKAVRDGNFRMIDAKQTVSPFSFFNYIVYNSVILTPKELETIIAHEKVHSSQLHSIDMLISQLACIAMWFNPIIWMYKKQVTQNLEFIADAEAARTIDDISAYQKTLLKITLQPGCIAITNHFYQSLIKKRIVMLNKQKSKRQNLIRFAFIVPALIAFIYLYQIKVIAKEKVPAAITLTTAISEKQVLTSTDIAYGNEITYPFITAIRINKDMTNAEMKQRKQMYKDLYDADVYFENIKRNKNNEITEIKVSVKDKNHRKAYPVYEILRDGHSPIHPFNLHIERNTPEGDNIIYFSGQNTGGETTYNKPEPDEPGKTLTDYINNAVKKERKIVVINGVVQTQNNYTLSGKEIDMVELSGEEAVKKYGEAAKNGALVFTITDFDPTSTDRTTNITHTTTKTEVSNNINTSITDRVKEMNASPTRTVTQIYLRDGEGNLIANDGITKYFVINSYTTDIQLNVYKEDLAEAGITVEYSDLVRNSKGKITGIIVKLNDKKGRTSATWSSDRNKDGIPDIYIGKIKGQLTASSSKTP